MYDLLNKKFYDLDDVCFTFDDGSVMKSKVPTPCTETMLNKFGSHAKGQNLEGSSCTCTKEGSTSKTITLYSSGEGGGGQPCPPNL